MDEGDVRIATLWSICRSELGFQLVIREAIDQRFILGGILFASSLHLRFTLPWKEPLRYLIEHDLLVDVELEGVASFNTSLLDESRITLADYLELGLRICNIEYTINIGIVQSTEFNQVVY